MILSGKTAQAFGLRLSQQSALTEKMALELLPQSKGKDFRPEPCSLSIFKEVVQTEATGGKELGPLRTTWSPQGT